MVRRTSALTAFTSSHELAGALWRQYRSFDINSVLWHALGISPCGMDAEARTCRGVAGAAEDRRSWAEAWGKLLHPNKLRDKYPCHLDYVDYLSAYDCLYPVDASVAEHQVGL